VLQTLGEKLTGRLPALWSVLPEYRYFHQSDLKSPQLAPTSATGLGKIALPSFAQMTAFEATSNPSSPIYKNLSLSEVSPPTEDLNTGLPRNWDVVGRLQSCHTLHQVSSAIHSQQLSSSTQKILLADVLERQRLIDCYATLSSQIIDAGEGVFRWHPEYGDMIAMEQRLEAVMDALETLDKSIAERSRAR